MATKNSNDEGLKPFISFFGAKWRSAPKYPKPLHDTIIEPFCGSAGYSLRYYQKNIELYEIDPVIFGVWDYLIKAKYDEIMALPTEFEKVSDLSVCQEAKWLIGFNVNQATSQPRDSYSTWKKQYPHWASFWGDKRKERVAIQVGRIKHWKCYNKSYADAPNKMASWFVDPPYQKIIKQYRYWKIDYPHLSEYCRTREGQVVVCESNGADWLPFESIGNIKSTPRNRAGGDKTLFSHEVIWSKNCGEKD